MAINLNSSCKEIKSMVATWRSFSPKNLVEDAVIYFCESHNDYPNEKEHIQAVINLMHKDFDLQSCEKYELRTGYLSRWNYMFKNFDEMSEQEVEQAINKGYEEESAWIKRCEPDLTSFMPKDWKDCISEKENPLILDKVENNRLFSDAFSKSVNSYADRHGKNYKNGEQYVLEEVSWIFSLPLVHLGEQIYLIHVGNDNPAIKEMFRSFSTLNKTVKWLSPRIREMTFKNDTDFLMYYNVNHVGYSYALENKDIIRSNFKLKKISLPSKIPTSFMEVGYMENVILQHIIEKLPCHVYWLNRENVYLGCNEVQAKDLGLQSRNEVIGKTNSDFHDSITAKELDSINEFVMSTGKPYEVEESGYVLGQQGQRKYYLTKKIALFDAAGKVIGLLGVSFDITEKKKAEELERQKELSEMANKWWLRMKYQPTRKKEGKIKRRKKLSINKSPLNIKSFTAIIDKN